MYAALTQVDQRLSIASRMCGLTLETARQRRRNFRLAAQAAGTPLTRWLLRAAYLAHERPSREISARMDAHWHALTVSTVRTGSRAELENLLLLLHGGCGPGLPWNVAAPGGPARGPMQGTHWAAIVGEARLRLLASDGSPDDGARAA